MGSVPDRIHPVKWHSPDLRVPGQCSVPTARYRSRSASDEVWIAQTIGEGTVLLTQTVATHRVTSLAVQHQLGFGYRVRYNS
jgi:hypothetical protein